MENFTTFKALIEYIKREKKYTYEDLAVITEINCSQLKKIANGKVSKPSNNTLLKLEKVTLDYEYDRHKLATLFASKKNDDFSEGLSQQDKLLYLEYQLKYTKLMDLLQQLNNREQLMNDYFKILFYANSEYITGVVNNELARLSMVNDIVSLALKHKENELTPNSQKLN